MLLVTSTTWYSGSASRLECSVLYGGRLRALRALVGRLIRWASPTVASRRRVQGSFGERHILTRHRRAGNRSGFSVWLTSDNSMG